MNRHETGDNSPSSFEKPLGGEHSPARPAASRDFQGQPAALVDRVVDLVSPEGNILLGCRIEDAQAAVRDGDVEKIRGIRGQFAICQQAGKTVRMARSIGRPMRYFLAKRAEGPALIVAERIDEIFEQLRREGLQDQFNPAYTRMVPAHHLLELQLVGCPDPNPALTRYFAPSPNRLPADVDAIGRAYIEKLAEICDQWIETVPPDEPIGVMFSGGIDSGSIVVLIDHLLRRRGIASTRLKAFTLAVGADSTDARQALEFLGAVGLPMIAEVVHVGVDQISCRDAIACIEDYKPLDVQSATMGLALLRQIRRLYPDWKYLIDGDGGDENLKDYPIEDNPELTIRSVLGNRMLYQEGWGVDAVKHSLTFSGGQSRGHVRTSAPAASLGFVGLSPYALPDVIEIAESIPFVALTDWDHEKLYALKGQIVAAGIRQVTGVEMPVYPKQRFQHGAAAATHWNAIFPDSDVQYREMHKQIFAAL